VTFLELCVELRRLAGISGTGPADVTLQTGEYGRVVQWITDSWLNIQSKFQGEWDFLWSEFSKVTVASTRDYEYRTSSGIAKFDNESFTIYLTADGVSTRRALQYVPYDEFKDVYWDAVSEDYPSVVTILPRGGYRLYPTPNDVYTVQAIGFDVPVRFAANDDTPTLPEELHMVIVYKALMDYAGYEASREALDDARLKFGDLWPDVLKLRYLPEDMVVRPR
jgi:hypothetical protein